MGLHRASNGDAKRMSFSTPSETDETISALAKQWGVSKSQAINILVDQGLAMEVLKEAGGEILYKHPHGETQVIFSPGVDRIGDPAGILNSSGG